MAEYKDTLNLPTTDFPMKASLSAREPSQLALWESADLYNKIRKLRAGANKFILHDGPPYANGHLHCGHALNKILKDFIIKSKTLAGFDAPFVPGWDCHGLPIELNVEKKIGKAGDKITASQFREKCREYADSQIAIQKQEFKRLGVFGDWANPYATQDFSYEANIIRALGKILANGHLEQGFKPVHWCIACGSALAEAEVDYEDKVSPSIDVAFPAVEPHEFIAKIDPSLTIKPLIVPIWTTTPWSLPGNEAVSFHPNLEYTLIDTKEGYLLVALVLLESVMQRYKLKDYKILGSALGSCFLNLELRHPFEDRVVPLILSEHVTTDAGTGSVHIAPSHGPEDYSLGKLYNLPLRSPVAASGCYKTEVPFFGGQHILKASEQILELLKEKGALLFSGEISHSYPHCWRHKTPMVYLATPQWFISMDKSGLRKAIIEKISTVSWIPEWGKPRITSMVENRPDWCISRQRAWGTPMPFFIHKETGQLHPNSQELLEKVAKLVEQKGIDSWFDLKEEDLLGEEAREYKKLTDTLDVWFDSGVSHYAVLANSLSLELPADIYFEGSDQHRGWFNSSLTTAVAIYGNAPYKTVLTHGYTVDASGHKLSKSKGNYVALDKLIDLYGADIIRLWVASMDYRNEVSISEEIIKRNADAYRRIRNTARFLLSNLADFDPENHLLKVEELLPLDKWILKSSQILQKEIIQHYNSYNFHLIYQKIHNFCAMDLGSFYLDVIKDRQYTTPQNSIARRSCQSVMYYIIHALTRWLAPILSFTAEEIWRYIPGNSSESVFLQSWYTDWPNVETVDMDFWQQIQDLRSEVNKALEIQRQAGMIGSGLAADVTLYAKPEALALLKVLKDELRFILITSEARVLPLEEKPDTLSINEDLGVAILVKASTEEKCARCWHRRADVGQDLSHPELCLRCASNISGKDEVRVFA